MDLQERVARKIDHAIWQWYDECLSKSLSRHPALEMKRRTSLVIAREVIALVRNPPPENAPA